jgi:hypothetical protein
MNVTTLLQLATLFSIVVGVIGLLISFRAYKRQLSAQFLLEYTRRFDELMRSLPPSVWAAEVFPDSELPELNDDLRVGILRCLNFVAQMHYFSRKGYIPRHVWRIQEDRFTRALRSPLFVREWHAASSLFANDRAFCRYVERIQKVTDEEPRSAKAPQGKSFGRTTRWHF